MDVVWLKESLSGSIEKCRILLSELESIYTASEDAVNYSRIRWTLNDLSTRGGNANDKASLTNYLKEVLNLRDNLLQGITIFYEDAGEPVPQHIREAARLTVPNQTAQSKPAVRFSTNGGPAAAVKIVVPPAVSVRSSSPRPQPFTQQPGMKKENTSSSSPPDQRQTRPDAAPNNRPFSPKIAAILEEHTAAN
ncbi:unnamed protein product [Dibothriocephalus latus]|uniref:Uncharacterized protein n=1 Tax=Dibothriocephalus latus TaxID=60516 RepID=A0A3P7LPV5_DIBLA|nr:unnamed protein product [Dibothriocephalus latus]